MALLTVGLRVRGVGLVSVLLGCGGVGGVKCLPGLEVLAVATAVPEIRHCLSGVGLTSCFFGGGRVGGDVCLISGPLVPACLGPGCGGPVEGRNVWEMLGNAKDYTYDPPEGAACLVPGLGPGCCGNVPGSVGPVDAPCLVPDDGGHGGPGGMACLVLEVGG